MPFSFRQLTSKVSVSWNSLLSHFKLDPVFKNKIVKLSVDVAVNGLFLNYAAAILVGMSFEVWTFPAYGFAWRYIREEIPAIIKNLTEGKKTWRP